MPVDEKAAGRIRRLEEVSIDAWPALQTVHCDGWVIRFADGFSRRSNSVVPLYPPREDVRVKIRACERLFRERGLRPTFKITPASQPAELDGVLAESGYSADAETSVQTLSLGGRHAPPGGDVVLRGELIQEWIDALCALNGYDPCHHSTVGKLTARVHPPRVFASAVRNGKIVGCGLGVARGGFIGLFDIVVDEKFRRQGLGRRIVAALLAWGKDQSAATAFLQVMTDNSGAAALYAGMGFREDYKYIYRMQA
ncbi:MAG: GNAT family N-acetyltransferase [Anaerolineales bacterium]|nr:GNAT family N-acetyltransferase [Anaerolineales bacterium]